MAVSRSLSLGRKFSSSIGWSGRKGGPVEPLSGPVLQRKVLVGYGNLKTVPHVVKARIVLCQQGLSVLKSCDHFDDVTVLKLFVFMQMKTVGVYHRAVVPSPTTPGL